MNTSGMNILSATVLAVALAAPQAHAALGDSLFASGGEIEMRFEGSNASFSSLVSVNGPPEIFPNRATAVGTTTNIGFFDAGTRLDVVLHVLTTGQFFHAGPGELNADGLPHALVTQADDRTFVSFEDLAGGGDRDYNDHMFSFTNVQTTVVPEPSVYALMLAGLVAVGFAARRSHPGR